MWWLGWVGLKGGGGGGTGCQVSCEHRAAALTLVVPVPRPLLLRVVQAALETAIVEGLRQRDASGVRDECTREAIRHLQFASAKCAAFVGREGLLHDLEQHWRRVRGGLALTCHKKGVSSRPNLATVHACVMLLQ